MSNIVIKYIHHISRGLAGIAVILILLMMVSTTADVGGRYLFNNPIPGTFELNRTLLVFVVFLTLGYAQLMKRHIRVELLPTRLPPRAGILLDGFGVLLGLALMGAITYGASITAYDATITGEYETGLINFPMWPGRIALAVGCLVLSIEYVLSMIEDFRYSLRKGN